MNCYEQMFVRISPRFPLTVSLINSLQLEISHAYHPKYPSAITDCRLWLCVVTLRLNQCFCDDKRLERRMAYFFPDGIGWDDCTTAVFNVDLL